MSDWIEFYDTDHSIYVSAKHRAEHFKRIAADMIALIPSRDAVVLDYACGEALGATDVAARCAKLILAEPAPSVRERVTRRFAAQTKIDVISLDDLHTLPQNTLDLAIMNSVSQYMTDAQIDDAFTIIRKLLKSDGRLIVGDVVRPDVGPLRDATALLMFGARRGFFFATFAGLVRTALSDYRKLRGRLGLKTYRTDEMLAKLRAAGFSARPHQPNIGHNAWRMAFEAKPTIG